MKVAILAGGYGTRLLEETRTKPKAMVEIGGYPILWHIMKYFSHYGFKEFVIALGYKGEHIKCWFWRYHLPRGANKVRKDGGETSFNVRARVNGDDWIVSLIDTGEGKGTGGRIKRLAPWLDDQTFMLTWVDGLSDIDLHALLQFHRSHGRHATLTAVHPPSRFGHLVLDGDRVIQFKEKPRIVDNWINGAFFVLEPDIFEYIQGDETVWEREPLEGLVRDSQLMAYHHDGFWQCMDTLHEKLILEDLWKRGKAPWKIWKD